MSASPNPVSYLKSWSNELSSQALRIRLLIGDGHWPSDGRHKELLLIGFLKRYLPTYLILGTGFITAQSVSSDCSREIDVIVCDPSLEPPWLNESGIIITPPTPVLAQIQVKSEFSAKNFSDIFDGFASSSSFFTSDGIWSGGFFYDFAEKETASLNETLKTTLTQLVQTSSRVLRTPICIAGLSGSLFLITAEAESKTGKRKYSLRAFSLGDLAPAVFCAHLFQHISPSAGQSRMLELTRYIKALEESMVDVTAIEAGPS
jgi:hypothetical protein